MYPFKASENSNLKNNIQQKYGVTSMNKNWHPPLVYVDQSKFDKTSSRFQQNGLHNENIRQYSTDGLHKKGIREYSTDGLHNDGICQNSTDGLHNDGIRQYSTDGLHTNGIRSYSTTQNTGYAGGTNNWHPPLVYNPNGLNHHSTRYNLDLGHNEYLDHPQDTQGCYGQPRMQHGDCLQMDRTPGRYQTNCRSKYGQPNQIAGNSNSYYREDTAQNRMSRAYDEFTRNDRYPNRHSYNDPNLDNYNMYQEQRYQDAYGSAPRRNEYDRYRPYSYGDPFREPGMRRYKRYPPGRYDDPWKQWMADNDNWYGMPPKSAEEQVYSHYSHHGYWDNIRMPRDWHPPQQLPGVSNGMYPPHMHRVHTGIAGVPQGYNWQNGMPYQHHPFVSYHTSGTTLEKYKIDRFNI